MTQSELPLYPKISSIYNKILQLAIAIVMLIILMNIMLDNHVRNQDVVQAHFSAYGDNYINQAADATLLLMSTGKKAQVNQHIEQLSQADFIQSVFLYDETGQVISYAGDNVNVNDLFGVGEFADDSSAIYRPFVSEVRGERLYGYLRMTIAHKLLVEDLSSTNQNNQELMRVMLIMAGVVGFLLTRGLSRFSRQGFRPQRS